MTTSAVRWHGGCVDVDARVGQGRDHAVVRDVIAQIRRRSTEPMTVDELAKGAAFSPSHLSRLFTRVTRTSPNRYLTAVRVEEAKTLLSQTSMSVLQICHTVGYDSIGTFTRRFTEQVGLSPTAFRAFGTVEDDAGPITKLLAPPRGGDVTGTVRLDASARRPSRIWLGLFPRPVPVGVPLAGTLLTGPGDFSIPLPAQRCWLLAAAPVTRGRPLVAQSGQPVEQDQPVQLVLRAWQPHQHPITVALPPLTR